MSDLAEYNTNMSVVPELIEELNKKVGDSEKPRTYLGASIIGTECERALWYEFRHCATKSFSGRLYRLFDTGRLEEPRFIAELRGIGCEVVDGEDAGQQIGVSAVDGHFKGHLDGAALGVPEAPKTWHVLEFKTHSDKSFTDVKKKGVKASKPLHHAQMMVYMGLTGMTRALYLAKNKNTDEIYAERIRFDAGEFKSIMDKAERIIYASRAPERIASRADDFRCRFCDSRALCWGQSTEKAVPLPFKGCRSCCHATPMKDGTWQCEFHKQTLSFDKQLVGCNKHLLLPDFVLFATPSDAGTDWVEYINEYAVVWRQGEGGYTTEQLLAGRGPMDATESANQIEVEDTGDIFDRYPPEDCRLVWEGSRGSDDALANYSDGAISHQLCLLMPDRTDEDVFPITNKGDDADKEWFEFAGKWLLVRYFKEGYAAIFEGVE